ncbi:hypothetical protein LWI28_025747 [Acer negundo]|uniref:Aldose 1-epimerase n=1 Tax=Acer negundo TaxID=4023 RepID=A0AAD5NEQ8_ACENE|nr:hypothetical protein LWI28_025747 [Acer negundo]
MATTEEVGVYELKKGNFSVKFTNWGATIISVVLPDKNWCESSVTLFLDTIQSRPTRMIQVTLVRLANRIGGAQFTLDGTTYKVVANEGNNTLHGGLRGFSDVWKVRTYKTEGFPGDLFVTVAYTLVGESYLSVRMRAKALNKAMPVNLVQHTYWNIGRHDSGDILSEEIQIFASHYTPVNSQMIRTGEIVSVKGTPYDFLKSYTVGSSINKLANGYDINYVLDGVAGKKMKPVANVHDKKTGRMMELWTTAPGVQFSTANFVINVTRKDGFVYQPHAALCLETQGFPDAVNHPNFPSTIVTPGQTYKHKMLFKFSVTAPSYI